MSPELTAAVIGAVIGSATAYLFGWRLKAFDERRRRTSIATAILWETYPLTNAFDALRASWPGYRVGLEFPTTAIDAFPRSAELFQRPQGVPPTPFYPRGDPLTESMPFTDAEGVCWLAYVEAVPPGRPPRRPDQAMLPGRRLRFESATESRATTHVPAGAPFLGDAGLRRLLDGAQPVPAPPPSRRSSDVRRHPVIELASRVEELGAVLADPSWPRRRTADQRLARLYRLRQLVATAFSRFLKPVAAALTSRRGR